MLCLGCLRRGASDRRTHTNGTEMSPEELVAEYKSFPDPAVSIPFARCRVVPFSYQSYHSPNTNYGRSWLSPHRLSLSQAPRALCCTVNFDHGAVVAGRRYVGRLVVCVLRVGRAAASAGRPLHAAKIGCWLSRADDGDIPRAASAGDGRVRGAAGDEAHAK